MTGRSLPGDLQRLLRARGAAGVRSLSASISKARSGRGLDGRLEGSRSDAPPAPGPRPGPASCAQPRAPGLQGDRRPGRQHGETARSRSALPGARRPQSRSARRPGSRPTLASPSPSPPLRSSSPAPAGPAGLPPWAKEPDALSQPGPPGYFSDAVTVFKTGRKKTCTERKCESSVQAKLPSPAGTAAGLPAPRPGCRAVRERDPTPSARPPWPRLPGVLTQPDSTSPRAPSPRKDGGAGGGVHSSVGAYGLRGLGSVPC